MTYSFTSILFITFDIHDSQLLATARVNTQNIQFNVFFQLYEYIVKNDIRELILSTISY
jgi:hypothetical protein